MELSFRRITIADAAQLLLVRSSTRENPYSIEALAEAGITEPSIVESLCMNIHDGCLCEADSHLIGFSMVDLKGGELLVVAVLPEFEGLGVGRKLLGLAEELLWAAGHSSIFLWTPTDRNTRAYHLYRSESWNEAEETAGKLFMRKCRSNQRLEPTLPSVTSHARHSSRQTIARLTHKR